MGDERYARNLENLVLRQNEERQRFQQTLEAVMSQLTQMTQLLDVRDREITQLRNAPANAVNVERPEERNTSKAPFSEIAAQISTYSFENEISMTLDMWLRKVELVKVAYQLMDDAIKMLATNKFDSELKRWYESHETLWTLSWEELIVKLKEMLGENKNIAEIMERMRARRWR